MRLALRLQPELDKAADGFGTARLIFLACGPGINIRHEFVGPRSVRVGAFPVAGRPRFLGVAFFIDLIIINAVH